jgi:hypothetical protein
MTDAADTNLIICLLRFIFYSEELEKKVFGVIVILLVIDSKI